MTWQTIMSAVALLVAGIALGFNLAVLIFRHY